MRLRLTRLPAFFTLLFLLVVGCAGDESVPGGVTPINPAETRAIPTPTLAPAIEAAVTATSIAAATATEVALSATPTPTPSATPVLSAEEHLTAGETSLALEDFQGAAEQLAAGLKSASELDTEAQSQAQFNLALALLEDGQFEQAAEHFNRYLAAAAADAGGLSPQGAAAYVYLGRAYAEMGDAAGAIGAYRSYLAANPDMGAYILPLLADLYLQAGDTGAAIAAFEEALTSNAQRLWQVSLRLRLADLYIAQESFREAQLQYDAVYEIAVTANTRGEMTYRAGDAALKAGDPETAHARFIRGIMEYPEISYSYLGLLELVAAGVEVDWYQRGLVDYYAGVYEPAVAAFEEYIAAQPAAYEPDAHRYLAWSHENLGNLDLAMQELDRYAAYSGNSSADLPFAANALLERADLLARNERNEEALAGYTEFLEAYPADEGAPHAALQLGKVHERLGNIAEAQVAYVSFAEAYPAHESAPDALLQAGWLAYESDEIEQARSRWQTLVTSYPGHPASDEAFVWLLRSTPASEAEPLAQQVISHTQPTGYYALRARELVRGEAPYTPPAGYQFTFDEEAAQQEAEAWLQAWLPDIAVTRTLTSAVTQDGRFVRGEKLWKIGLREEARQEFESLRSDYAGNALVSYQLALYLRDLGAYRSSIGAAASVLALSGQTIFEAPGLIGRLLYPVYYSELIVPLAEQYGYDPLLQFALVRQESLFESFAASHVGAQGLSQVMPATGAEIAERLNWPDYETADLVRPHVGLAFGAYYIATQLDFFDGNIPVALSAYNAGPGNAARWFAVAGSDLDLYLRTVDFAETRLYIRRIHEGYQYYRYLYGVDDVAGDREP